MLAHRLGSALLLLGLITLVVFLLTLSIQQADPLVLLAGAAASLCGLLLRRRRSRPAAEPMLGEPYEDSEG